jgi:hypothetical protein
VPQERGPEATAEQTMEMGHHCLIVKIRRSRQGEIIVDLEENMDLGVLDRVDEGRKRRDICTQPA